MGGLASYRGRLVPWRRKLLNLAQTLHRLCYSQGLVVDVGDGQTATKLIRVLHEVGEELLLYLSNRLSASFPICLTHRQRVQNLPPAP